MVVTNFMKRKHLKQGHKKFITIFKIKFLLCNCLLIFIYFLKLKWHTCTTLASVPQGAGLILAWRIYCTLRPAGALTTFDNYTSNPHLATIHPPDYNVFFLWYGWKIEAGLAYFFCPLSFITGDHLPPVSKASATGRSKTKHLQIFIAVFLGRFPPGCLVESLAWDLPRETGWQVR